MELFQILILKCTEAVKNNQSHQACFSLDWLKGEPSSLCGISRKNCDNLGVLSIVSSLISLLNMFKVDVHQWDRIYDWK